MKNGKVIVLGVVVALSVVAIPAGFAGASQSEQGAKLRASATLFDQAGTQVGKAHLMEKRDGDVVVSVSAEGLTPGAHGIHVHAVGSCASANVPFSGAGPHFNPDGGSHGSHAGDLGNIVANDTGSAALELVTRQFSLSAGPSSVLDADGAALVIHARPDDGVSDPSGNSGARVICGIFVGD